MAMKQLQAQQNRADARIKKQIETAQKEMVRLEKYVNLIISKNSLTEREI